MSSLGSLRRKEGKKEFKQLPESKKYDILPFHLFKK